LLFLRPVKTFIEHFLNCFWCWFVCISPRKISFTRSTESIECFIFTLQLLDLWIFVQVSLRFQFIELFSKLYKSPVYFFCVHYADFTNINCQKTTWFVTVLITTLFSQTFWTIVTLLFRSSSETFQRNWMFADIVTQFQRWVTAISCACRSSWSKMNQPDKFQYTFFFFTDIDCF
jgi:hypothetical protein